jgi:hypothetical protein
MTVQTEIIEPALRLLNIRATTQTFDASELNTALAGLNGLQRGMFGTIIGGPLVPILVPSSTTANNGGNYIITGSGVTLTLAPGGVGSRFAVTINGGSGNINGGGSLIEGQNSIPVITRTWFYRDDQASWLPEQDVPLNGSTLFPTEMNEHLINMLAARIAPAFGEAQVLGPTTKELAVAGFAAFRRRYGRRD